MRSLFAVIDIALSFYSWAVILAIVMSWLVAFDVLNRHNRVVYSLYDGLNRFIEPALRRIRRYVPSVAGFDLSPFILILAIIFLRSLMREYGPL